MMQINLLPWRESARKVKKRRFIAGIIATLILAVILIILCHIYLSSFAHEQDYINNMLQNEVNNEQAGVTATNTEQKEKIALEKQLKNIISLYNKSYDAIRFLDEIANIVPQSISLTKIIRTDNVFTLDGYATSDRDVTTFLDTVKKSPIVAKAYLNKLSSGMAANTNRRIFEIVMEEKEQPIGKH